MRTGGSPFASRSHPQPEEVSMGHQRLGLVRNAAVLALCLALPAAAMPSGPVQGRARIEGRITSPNGKTISGVSVTLKNDGYSPLRSIYSDSAGRFQFNVPEGAYYIEVD